VIITPPTRKPPHRPVALLAPGYRSLQITTAEGSDSYRGTKTIREQLERIEKHACYVAGGVTAMRHTTGARQWSATSWRGRTTSMKLDGTDLVVTSLRGCLENAKDPFAELEIGLEWLYGHGIRAGSISSMGWALWRSTVSHELQIAASPDLGREALYGGRQSVSEPRTYQHMVAADIRRAQQATTATVGPDTAQKLMGMKKAGLMENVGHGAGGGALLALLGEHFGGHFGGAGLGMAGAVGLPYLNMLRSSMKAAGINTMNDLTREAMLHPEIAHLIHQTAEKNAQITPIFARRFATAIQSAMVADASRQSGYQRKDTH